MFAGQEYSLGRIAKADRFHLFPPNTQILLSMLSLDRFCIGTPNLLRIGSKASVMTQLSAIG